MKVSSDGLFLACYLLIKDVTLSLDTSAYGNGDVLAATQEIEEATNATGEADMVHSVVVIDKDNQKKALDLVFLKSDVSIGSENGAVSITDADADEIYGIVEIGTSDYVAIGDKQIVTKTGVDLPVNSEGGSTSLFVAAISRGTGTYTASGIILKVALEQH